MYRIILFYIYYHSICTIISIQSYVTKEVFLSKFYIFMLVIVFILLCQRLDGIISISFTLLFIVGLFFIHFIFISVAFIRFIFAILVTHVHFHAHLIIFIAIAIVIVIAIVVI